MCDSIIASYMGCTTHDFKENSEMAIELVKDDLSRCFYSNTFVKCSSRIVGVTWDFDHLPSFNCDWKYLHTSRVKTAKGTILNHLIQSISMKVYWRRVPYSILIGKIGEKIENGNKKPFSATY